jgi:hypothetical protein
MINKRGPSVDLSRTPDNTEEEKENFTKIRWKEELEVFDR